MNRIPKPKFSVGQKIYYKVSRDSEKAYSTTIKEIKICIRKRKDKDIINVQYFAHRRYVGGWRRGYRRYGSFVEKEIYKSEKEATKRTSEQKKKKMLRKIRILNRSIASNKKSIASAQKRLDDIKKEDVIVKLAGIG